MLRHVPWTVNEAPARPLPPDRPEREVFGSPPNGIRYDADRLDAVNATRYGLTLGIHSHITETVDGIHKHRRAGNAPMRAMSSDAAAESRPAAD